MVSLLSRAVEVYRQEGFLELCSGGAKYLNYRMNHWKRRNRIQELIEKEGELIERDVNGYRMRLDLTKGGICSSIALNGYYGKEMTDAFSNILLKVEEKFDDLLIFDVGANIGYFVLLEAHLMDAAPIYAYEPSPENVEMLSENILLNGYEDRVYVNQCAVGAEPGSAELQLGAHPNDHAISTVNKPNKDMGRISVDVVSIDDELSQIDFDPSMLIVRMDVEGFEHEVIRGMQGAVESDVPMVVVAELHPTVPPEEMDHILSLLDRTGFELIFDENTPDVERENLSWEDISIGVSNTTNIIGTRGI